VIAQDDCETVDCPNAGEQVITTRDGAHHLVCDRCADEWDALTHSQPVNSARVLAGWALLAAGIVVAGGAAIHLAAAVQLNTAMAAGRFAVVAAGMAAAAAGWHLLAEELDR